MEATMLVCETAIFVCSVLIIRWDMAEVGQGNLQAYHDMKVYTVMCSISTFAALAVTLSFFIVPTQVRL